MGGVEMHDKLGFMNDMISQKAIISEIFSKSLLDSLDKHFNLDQTMIVCYDEHQRFLSWTDRSKLMLDSKTHPYHEFSKRDLFTKTINQESKMEKLFYDNVTPKIYRSSVIIPEHQYEQSAYVQFLQKQFGMKYSLVMPFGPNGCVHISSFKKDEDFTEAEIKKYEDIYQCVALSYKDFKVFEKARIISSIQDEIIMSGEKAYFITDSGKRILAMNCLAKAYLKELLGESAVQDEGKSPCTWLPFLLEGHHDECMVSTKIIAPFLFKIYSFHQSYSHGIVERYHWIVLDRLQADTKIQRQTDPDVLTPAERKVADLLVQGYTYRAIAEKLYVSYHTVKNQVANIYSKYGVNSRYLFTACYKKE